MNRDITEGTWKQIKGRVRQQWGRLTDNDVEEIGGRYDRLVGKLQEKYGDIKDQIAGQVNDFLDAAEETTDEAKKKPSKHS